MYIFKVTINRSSCRKTHNLPLNTKYELKTKESKDYGTNIYSLETKFTG